MSVALAGQSQSVFEIKSASMALLALRLKSPDLDRLAAELEARYGDLPEFFENDALVLDLADLESGEPRHAAAPEPIDFARLAALMAAYRLNLVAVRGGDAAHAAGAAAAGLALLPAAAAPKAAAPAAAREAPVAPVAEPPDVGALIVDRPLRSGQQVYARGRDLVVLAMVNPGAEVIADGHVHIYAPLRGRAIAGARGWGDARIFARELSAELVSIAGVYRTTEEPLPSAVWGQPASVRLASSEAGDKLLFEPMTD